MTGYLSNNVIEHEAVQGMVNYTPTVKLIVKYSIKFVNTRI